jgi:hypothetical protein
VLGIVLPIVLAIVLGPLSQSSQVADISSVAELAIVLGIVLPIVLGIVLFNIISPSRNFTKSGHVTTTFTAFVKVEISTNPLS